MEYADCAKYTEYAKYVEHAKYAVLAQFVKYVYFQTEHTTTNIPNLTNQT